MTPDMFPEDVTNPELFEGCELECEDDEILIADTRYGLILGAKHVPESLHCRGGPGGRGRGAQSTWDTLSRIDAVGQAELARCVPEKCRHSVGCAIV